MRAVSPCARVMPPTRWISARNNRRIKNVAERFIVRWQRTLDETPVHVKIIEAYDPIMLDDFVQTMPARKSIRPREVTTAFPVPTTTWVTHSAADIFQLFDNVVKRKEAHITPKKVVHGIAMTSRETAAHLSALLLLIGHLLPVTHLLYGRPQSIQVTVSVL